MRLIRKMDRRIITLITVLLLSLCTFFGTCSFAALAVRAAGTSHYTREGSRTLRAQATKKKKKNKNKNNQNNSQNSSQNNGQSSQNDSQNGGQNSWSSSRDGNSGTGSVKDAQKGSEEETELIVEEDGTYTSKEEVALYLHLFGHLPDNYITKNEAKDLGWVNSEGNLDEVAPGKSIGGDRFGNYEGQLPEKKGRKYFECDIDYEGGYRESKRIIFSNDGLVFYTEDHYNTFEQLY